MDGVMETEAAYISEAYNSLINFGVDYGMQVIGAILILIVGAVVANWASKAAVKYLDRKNIDITFSHFIANVLKAVILLCFVIIALGKFGISVTPFIAAIGAIGLGAGFAVQGLLSNYAAGLAIIFTRPFKIGDTIVVYGYTGQIVDIKLAATLLITEDKVLITIPNRYAVGEVLQNTFEYKMVETLLHVDQQHSPEQVVALINQCLSDNDSIIDDPQTQVGIEAFDEGNICIGIRCWVPTKRYYQEKFTINMAVYNTLRANGIAIAAPKRLQEGLSE